MVAVLELALSDSVALNSPRRARVVDEAGLEMIEMCDAGLAAVERGERRGDRRATCGFKSMAVGYLPTEPDSLIDTTDDFEDSEETDATVQQYQEYFGNLYDLGFRLVSIGP